MSSAAFSGPCRGHNRRAMRGLSGDELLRLPVRLHGIDLARPVDVVVDAEARRAVGLELLCGDGVTRFLPFGAATVTDREITVDSALAVVDDLRFYLDRGRALRQLRGSSVVRGRFEEGRLADVVVGAGGDLVQIVLADADGGQRVAYTDDLSLRPVAVSRPAA